MLISYVATCTYHESVVCNSARAVMFLGAIPNELWAIYQHNIIIMEYNYSTINVRVPPNNYY